MIEIEARPRWRQPKYDYKINDNTVTVADSEVGKITGTSIGQLLGLSPYNSPFTATQSLLGINDKDLSDNKAVRTGVQLEPRIIDYLAKHHSDLGTFATAETVFQARNGEHENWASDWEDADFGGHVDAIISNGSNDYILEIKTVKDFDKWDGQIPEHYLWQVYLYNHFIAKQDIAYFGIGVVTDEDYKNPNHWIPNESNCFIVPISIDRKMVESTLNDLRQFRASIVKSKTTPAYNPLDKFDVELWQHLNDYIASKEDIINLSQRIAYLSQDIQQKRQSYAKEEHELDTAKARLKDIMLYRDLIGIGNINLSVSNRVTVDIERAQQDGIDLSDYITVTKVHTLRVSK